MRINSITDSDSDEMIVEVYGDALQPVTSQLIRVDHPAAIASLASRFPRKPSGILPPGLLHVSRDQSLVIFERPPNYIDVTYTHMGMKDIESGATVSRENYVIPLPWLVYVGVISPTNDPLAIWVFATTGQMKSFDQPIGAFPLPNFYQDSRLCMAPQSNETNPDIQAAINGIFEAVWATHFNADLFHIFSERFPAFAPPANPSYQDFVRKASKAGTLTSRKPQAGDMFKWWSELTLIDMLKVNILPVGYPTLRDLIAAHSTGKLTENILDEVNWDHFFVSRVLTALQNNAV